MDQNTQETPSQAPGFIYVLFDGFSGLCKIGRTRRPGAARQRAIMGGAGRVLLHAMSLRVDDCVAAEKQCHQHFSAHRTNGEWFAVDLPEVIEYCSGHIDWSEMDIEAPGRTLRYLLACRLGDQKSAKEAVSRRA